MFSVSSDLINVSFRIPLAKQFITICCAFTLLNTPLTLREINYFLELKFKIPFFFYSVWSATFYSTVFFQQIGTVLNIDFNAS